MPMQFCADRIVPVFARVHEQCQVVSKIDVSPSVEYYGFSMQMLLQFAIIIYLSVYYLSLFNFVSIIIWAIESLTMPCLYEGGSSGGRHVHFNADQQRRRELRDLAPLSDDDADTISQSQASVDVDNIEPAPLPDDDSNASSHNSPVVRLIINRQPRPPRESMLRRLFRRLNALRNAWNFTILPNNRTLFFLCSLAIVIFILGVYIFCIIVSQAQDVTPDRKRYVAPSPRQHTRNYHAHLVEPPQMIF